MFQSSPAPKGGRYKCNHCIRRFNYSFNPRPPRRAGATKYACGSVDAAFVSILARPEGRALREREDNTLPKTGFQSSPAPKGGRYLG